MASPYYYPGAINPYQAYTPMQPQIQPQQMYAQQAQQMPQVQQQAQPQQQIQNGGFISVRSRAEAQNYPVAPGNSVTFKDETAPFVYVKTMGFSQLDRPIFESYRLVKEDAPQTPVENGQNMADKTNNIDLSDYMTKAEFEPILARIEVLEAVKQKKPKKEAENDE